MFYNQIEKNAASYLPAWVQPVIPKLHPPFEDFPLESHPVFCLSKIIMHYFKANLSYRNDMNCSVRICRIYLNIWGMTHNYKPLEDHQPGIFSISPWINLSICSVPCVLFHICSNYSILLLYNIKRSQTHHWSTWVHTYLSILSVSLNLTSTHLHFQWVTCVIFVIPV